MVHFFDSPDYQYAAGGSPYAPIYLRNRAGDDCAAIAGLAEQHKRPKRLDCSWNWLGGADIHADSELP
jgi:hypothetical protein